LLLAVELVSELPLASQLLLAWGMAAAVSGLRGLASRMAGFGLGWVSALDLAGRTIWIVDARRDDGKWFIVRADES